MTITPDGILEAFYSSIAMTAKLGTTTILMRTDEISLLIATGSGTAAVDGIQYETEKGSILSNIDIDVYLILGRVKYDRFNVPRFDKSKRAGRNLFDEFIHGKTSAQKYTSNPVFPLNRK